MLKKVKTYETNTKKYDTRTKFEIYKDLKRNDKNIKVSLSGQFHIGQNNQFYLLSEFQIQKLSTVMKMDTIQFIKAIDMVSIIQMLSGIVKVLNIF